MNRKDLNKLAKESGIKYYQKYNRFELANLLSVKLPPPKPRPKRTRVYARRVHVGEEIFPSMISAAISLGIFPVQIDIIYGYKWRSEFFVIGESNFFVSHKGIEFLLT